MGTRAVAVSTTVNTVVPSEVGVSRLLEDLARLLEDKESADVVFLVGRETPFYAHKIIMKVRCKKFSEKIIESSGNLGTIRMPEANPETFRQFLRYIYTGKIMLQDNGIFEMLGLAHELGVEQLWRSCEEHVSATLSPDSVCTLLSTALEAQDRVLGGKDACASFIEECFTYIHENAVDTFQTNAFCSLPKDAVIKIISSDYLGLAEVEVWRAVLKWAKYQAGVTQPTQHWTEEEKARVCQHLSGVIKYVRLLLIDSRVFKEEVEPTGAVPVHLSLARQPRVGPFLFSRSQILPKDKIDFQLQLNEWYGVPTQSWRLIYRASSDGYAASAFHQHCDEIAPIYVIVLGEKGEICGGFSDVAWSKSNTRSHNYIYSEKAFLYTLINQEKVPPTRYDVVRKPFAICHSPEIGPMFGAGADLCISSNCNANMDSYSNLPHSYEGKNASNSILMGGYHFSVLDYEAFTISNNAGPSS